MKKKIEKKVFVFQVIPSEFIALNSLHQERILGFATQCVRKPI